MIGDMGVFQGEYDSTPKDNMICNGKLLPSANYPDLFKVIGTKYGGDPTNFALPNFGQLDDMTWYVIQVIGN